MFATCLSEGSYLQILEIRHAPQLFELVRKNLDRLVVWCPWLSEVETQTKTETFIRSKLERYAASNGFTAGIFMDKVLSGVIALEYIDQQNLSTEIGYWIDSNVEGKGTITAACRLLISHAFNDLGLNRVQIRCASENSRSRSVAERLGFRLEGTIRQCEQLADRTVDLAIYGLLGAEWTSKA